MTQEASEPGIYVVICRPTGERWIGRVSDVAAVERRGAFVLSFERTPDRSFRSAAREYGPAAFAFELLERLDQVDPSAVSALDILGSRMDHWRTIVGTQAQRTAQSILPG